ncbi:MAG: AIR synthase [Lentisphaerae bacterium]|nr:AIR synthase [Lentisphaerota bacterium]
MSGSQMPDIGKVSPAIFNEVILRRLGKRRSEVLVGPQNGVDVGVTRIGRGRVMVTTTDPIFVVPAYGWERSAWFAVHILASDAATSGLPPQYITMDLNLPLSMDREAFELFWNVVHDECRKIGMAIVSGHTGRYHGCEYPMVGGATVICVGPENGYVTPTMARPGDRILITKGAAVEAAGLFAVTFPDKVAAKLGAAFAKRAEKIFWQMSVVDDALTAASVGVRNRGVTSMHDATECGVWGGLYEVAKASRVGMAIEKSNIIVQDDIRAVCDLFGIDPYSSISEGTLILTCRPHKSAAVLARLADRGIPAGEVGEVVPARQGIHVFENGRKRKLVHPVVDPFWSAFGREAAAAASK